MKKASVKRKLKKIPGFFKRVGLVNRNFTIISNNCWGGSVYDNFSLPYKTPTIGLFIMPDDYIKFLKNMNYYLDSKLVKVNWDETPFCEFLYDNKNIYKKNLNKDLNDLVIARLHDIYIVFLHYNSFDEANKKWNRRKKRINLNNCVVKFNDQNNFKKNNFEEFDKLPFKNKIFYTASDEFKSSYSTKIVYLKQYKNNGYVLNDMNFKEQNFNLKKYLNSIK